jgi:hypothetical protein
MAQDDVISSFCKTVAQYDDQIVITAMLKDSEPVGSYVKAGTPLPNLSMKTIKIIQASLIASIVRENESYLGKVNHIKIDQELADVILFPHAPNSSVFCVVVQRPYNFDRLAAKVLQSLKDSIICSFE